jgi:hypothetical protein
MGVTCKDYGVADIRPYCYQSVGETGTEAVTNVYNLGRLADFGRDISRL